MYLCYLLLAVRCLVRHGDSLENWFSSIEDKNLRGLRTILSISAVCWVFHIPWTWISWSQLRQSDLLSASMLLVQLAFLNALVMEAIGHPTIVTVPTPAEPRGEPHYSAEQLDHTARLIRSTVEERRLFLDLDLTLHKLARGVRCPDKLVSNALNGPMRRTFYHYVNGCRIAFARQLIEQDPTARSAYRAELRKEGSDRTSTS